MIVTAEPSIEFDTGEATWMSVDIPSAGRTLFADMLGDQYTLPASGPTLQPLTTGMEWDYQARYSHGGNQSGFISDRGVQITEGVRRSLCVCTIAQPLRRGGYSRRRMSHGG